MAWYWWVLLVWVIGAGGWVLGFHNGYRFGASEGFVEGWARSVEHRRAMKADLFAESYGMGEERRARLRAKRVH
jgi:hypothetical protein